MVQVGSEQHYRGRINEESWSVVNVERNSIKLRRTTIGNPVRFDADASCRARDSGGIGIAKARRFNIFAIPFSEMTGSAVRGSLLSILSCHAKYEHR